MPMLTMRMSDGEHAALKRLAERRGESAADTVRAGLALIAAQPFAPRWGDVVPAEGEGGTGELPAPGVVTPANPSRPEPHIVEIPLVSDEDAASIQAFVDHVKGEPTGVPDRLQSGPAEGSNPSSPAEADVVALRGGIPYTTPDEKPPTTRAKAPAPKVSKNAAEASDALAAAIAARAKQREPEHQHKSVARKGSTNPGCVSCPAILVGHTWITPETTADPAAPTDDDEW